MTIFQEKWRYKHTCMHRETRETLGDHFPSVKAHSHLVLGILVLSPLTSCYVSHLRPKPSYHENCMLS